MKIKQAINQAKNGKKLSKDKRLQVLKYLLEHQDLTTPQLASFLNVSERTVCRDKQEVRAEVQASLIEDNHIAADLALERSKLLRKLKNYRDSAQGSEYRLACRDIWRIIRDSFDRIQDLSLEKRIEKLERQVGIDEK